MNQEPNSLNDGVFAGDLYHSIFVLSQGNPGAAAVIVQMIAKAVKIDPQAWGKELHPLMEFDNFNLRGTEIHAFLKYTCNHSMVTAFAMFRAVQLGITRRDDLLDAIRDRKPIANCESVVKQVKAQLASFGHYAAGECSASMAEV